MEKLYYKFKRPIERYQASELNKKIWYLSEKLKGYELQYEGENCVGISVIIDESEYQLFIKYLCTILENDIYELKNIKSKDLWNNPLLKCIFRPVSTTCTAF